MSSVAMSVNRPHVVQRIFARVPAASILVGIGISFFMLTFMVRYQYPFRPYFFFALAGLCSLMVLRSFLAQGALFPRFALRDSQPFALFGLIFIFGLVNVVTSATAIPANLLMGAVNQVISQALLLFLLLTAAAAFSLHRQRFADVSAKFIFVFGSIALLVAVDLLLSGRALWGPITVLPHRDAWLRLHGWFGNPNYLAPYLSMAILAAMYRLHIARRGRLFWIGAVTFLAFGLLGTGSRGSLLAVLCAVAMFIGITAMGKRRPIVAILKLVLFAISGAFAALLVLSLFYGQDLARTFNMVVRIGSLVRGGDRVEIWVAAMETYRTGGLTALLFGFGNDFTSIATGKSAHSLYVKFLLERGVIFTSMVIAYGGYLLIWAAQRFRESLDPSFAYFAAIVTFCYTWSVTQAMGMFTGGSVGLFFIYAVVGLTLASRMRAPSDSIGA